MLTHHGRSVFYQIMKWGCLLKVYPFTWDAQNLRFEHMSTWQHRIIFHIHRTLVCSAGIFALFRFGTHFNVTDISPRLRTMGLVWALAYLQTIFNYIQFELRKCEIMQFSNSLFAALEKSANKPEKKQKSKHSTIIGKILFTKCIICFRYFLSLYIYFNLAEQNEKYSKSVSTETMEISSGSKSIKSHQKTTWHVYICALLLVTNPAIHASVLFDIPCSPNFFSSIILPCKSFMDADFPFSIVSIFIFIDNWCSSIMFIVMSFNWCIIFLGLTWILEEIGKIR